MRPVLFRFPDWIPFMGEQPITTFGVMLLAAVLAAGALFVRRLRRHAPSNAGWELVVAAAVGGVIGAKLLHLGVHAALGIPGGGVGRTGLTWFGALAGGTAVLFWQARGRHLPAAVVAGAAASPLLLGYAIGRVGAFLAGTDYGLPTGLPWGMAFPVGAPPTTPSNLWTLFGVETPARALAGDFVRVHPTQLYSAALSLAGLAVVERFDRSGQGAWLAGGGWRLFGYALILNGAARIPVELLRAKQDHVFGPITVDLVLALTVTALGVGLVLRRDVTAPVHDS
jgi:phosphatidylglycerol---prolipoprotein diacylglyceryl transferase